MWHCVICLCCCWLLVSLWKLWHHEIVYCFSYWDLINTLFFHAATNWHLIYIYWRWNWFLFRLLYFYWGFCCFFCCFFNWWFDNLPFLWVLWHLKFLSSANRLLIKCVFTSTKRLLIECILTSSSDWLVINIF